MRHRPRLFLVLALAGVPSGADAQSTWSKVVVLCQSSSQARQFVESHYLSRSPAAEQGGAGCTMRIAEYTRVRESERFVLGGRLFKVIEVIVSRQEERGAMHGVPLIRRYSIVYEIVYAF